MMRFDDFVEKYVVPVLLVGVLLFCLAMMVYGLVEFSS